MRVPSGLSGVAEGDGKYAHCRDTALLCPYSERNNVMFAVLFSLFCLQDAVMLYFLLVIAVYYPHFLRFVR
jgi:hypothetical protein